MIVKLNSKNQITLPSGVRVKLNIQAGDRLLMDVQDGVIVLIPQPESYTVRLRGLHAKIWKDLDVKKYLEEERSSWTD
jgi:AbrB family looped-hinge helix DNA binding protein